MQKKKNYGGILLVAGFMVFGKGMVTFPRNFQRRHLVVISIRNLKSGWISKIGAPYINEKHSIFNKAQTYEFEADKSGEKLWFYSSVKRPYLYMFKEPRIDSARAGNRFLDSLKGLQIRAQY